MNLPLSFRSELLKSKGTSLWYLLVLLSLFTPFITFIDYYHEANHSARQDNPWGQYLEERFQLLNIVILPLFTVLACTLAAQIEYRNNTWKQVLTSPQTKYAIFFSKYAVVLVLLTLFVGLHNVLILALPALLDRMAVHVWFRPFSPDWKTLLDYNLRTLICIQGVSTLQFWLGIRYRNFIVPIGLGFGLWLLAAMLTFELRLARADLHPFTYPIYAIFKQFEPKLPALFTGSLLYGIVFLGVGFIEFNRRSLKE